MRILAVRLPEGNKLIPHTAECGQLHVLGSNDAVHILLAISQGNYTRKNFYQKLVNIYTNTCTLYCILYIIFRVHNVGNVKRVF